MAKRGKVLPARKQGDRSRDDESLLIRSAESLGRMIGSLQRQLDGATRRLSATADDVMPNLPEIRRGTGGRTRKGASKTPKKKSARPGGARAQGRARKGASKATKKR
jgi:hypothetical protein